jgi:putative hydrolase of the HAD superfamily
MREVGKLILDYMTERLQMPAETADLLRQRYLVEYGTTMAGLLRHWQIDPDDYLAFVHDVPVDAYLRPNRQLDAVLAAMPYPKAIWTNGSREHAHRVLATLGIGHHFETIIDVRDMDYISKPAPENYPRMLALLGIAPHECVLVEDSVRNLKPAKSLGIITVLVDGDVAENVDFVINRVEDIERVVREVL